MKLLEGKVEKLGMFKVKLKRLKVIGITYLVLCLLFPKLGFASIDLVTGLCKGYTRSYRYMVIERKHGKTMRELAETKDVYCSFGKDIMGIWSDLTVMFK